MGLTPLRDCGGAWLARFKGEHMDEKDQKELKTEGENTEASAQGDGDQGSNEPTKQDPAPLEDSQGEGD